MIDNIYINRAIDYILENLQENITVNDISNYCNFSRYYFSRMFKKAMGESVYEFVKRLKMEQSAFRLKVEKHKNITDIGYTYGYSSSNFSSAFKQHHALSPAEFRFNISKKSLINPIFYCPNTKLETFDECNKKIFISVLEDFYVIYERHKGSYLNLSAIWKAFQQKYRQYISSETLFIERTFDDPSITDVDKCLYDVCMTIPKHIKLDNVCTLKGGKFAIYSFNDHVKKLYNAYQTIFNVWLSKSNNILDERYGFEIYRHIDCVSMNMKVDLCIPIK